MNNAKVQAEAESGHLCETRKCSIRGSQGTVRPRGSHTEASATRARDAARKLNEARLVEQAMEEGRRLGFEGIRRGKELGLDEGRNLAYEEGEQQDEEELTPPGTPPPPVLPPKGPAPREIT